ncbi:MAG: TrbI/VirB10 family protein [Bradyrhizobium sp.]|uniref:TrbI/VirB10 family protein n=4 Tax=Pseudomonadota TaxID=1224 RepID=A0ABS5GGB3_9BRAD|nr:MULTISPECIES: TrbI/VirB10 family protein [Bradyrhizobium]RTM03001.1 MAG: TrbI/VirB10 family protein [Bradyrhizobiaceae bacterium]ABQ33727.1 conjugal transfer protein trbI [Bradyrhizobium sp. BTAi1]MBR1140382.1 TrbI/VirB10 family protein [Bradyrhizobium denitrificans]MCL8487963.1 TrbI/VirB10 family protein [Bradyrhizobium denitrificans]MDH6263915.1 type IV secretory pathway VirB10-like protein [Bradyrhizobium sp. BR13661]
MTDNGSSERVSPSTGPRSASTDHTQAVRLATERPKITRLSRKILAGGSTLALLLVAGAVLWALGNPPHNPALGELYSTDHHNVADGLTKLPQDYGGVSHETTRSGPPKLGDPAPASATAASAIGLDAEQQRANQETEAARTSKVFASTTAPPTSPHAASQETATNATASSSDETFTQNGQDRKQLFVNAPIDRRTTAPDRLLRPASPYVVQAGTIIPAALMTGIRSDLPGQITAQVTEAVYDTPSGRAKLIPQGARLIGIYDSQVAFGQSRVLLVWTRLIMPDGRSIVLERQQGTDAGGYSGLEDDVDNHWAELFKAALLSTTLGVGAELGSGADSGSNTDIVHALRLTGANSLNQTGQQVVRRNLNIQPTLTIRPGFPIRVIVNRDLVIEP